jgi:hypothetical protein
VSHLFDAELLLRSLAALVAVIGLMLAAAWVLRRLGARGGFGPLAGKRRLAGDTAHAATTGEVQDLCCEALALKECVADLTLENRLPKRGTINRSKSR